MKNSGATEEDAPLFQSIQKRLLQPKKLFAKQPDIINFQQDSFQKLTQNCNEKKKEFFSSLIFYFSSLHDDPLNIQAKSICDSFQHLPISFNDKRLLSEKINSMNENTIQEFETVKSKILTTRAKSSSLATGQLINKLSQLEYEVFCLFSLEFLQILNIWSADG